ncbi:unnamed protein product, partial [Closterium sp. NIES-54]
MSIRTLLSPLHSTPSPPSHFPSTQVPYIQGFSTFRDDVRAAVRRNATKDELLSLTDKVRDHAMVDLGIRCEDRGGAGAEAAVVKLDDPKVLRAERDERIAKAAAEAKRKLQTKLAAKLKDLERWQSASVPPSDIFRKAVDKYSAWDDKGVPTHDKDGKELSAKAKKGVDKELKKAEESFAKYQQKMGEHPGMVAWILLYHPSSPPQYPPSPPHNPPSPPHYPPSPPHNPPSPPHYPPSPPHYPPSPPHNPPSPPHNPPSPPHNPPSPPHYPPSPPHYPPSPPHYPPSPPHNPPFPPHYPPSPPHMSASATPPTGEERQNVIVTKASVRM